MTNHKLAATGYTGPPRAQRARAAELHGAYHNNEDVPPLSLPDHAVWAWLRVEDYIRRTL